MLVKIVKNGVESEWFELTKQRHRALLEDTPEAVITLIDNLYTNSPDSGTYVKLDFSLFTLLARDFVLEENRQEKMIERYHDRRSLGDISDREIQGEAMSMEEEFIQRELLANLSRAKRELTPAQRRRVRLHVEKGHSLREIAAAEGVHNTVVCESIFAALRKMKKILD